MLLEIKQKFLKTLSFQMAKPAADTCLAVPNQKHSISDAAAQVGFSVEIKPEEIASTSVKFRPNVISSQLAGCRVRKKQTKSRCNDCEKGVCPQQDYPENMQIVRKSFQA